MVVPDIFPLLLTLAGALPAMFRSLYRCLRIRLSGESALLHPDQLRSSDGDGRAGTMTGGLVHCQQTPRLPEFFSGVGGNLLEMIGKIAA